MTHRELSRWLRKKPDREVKSVMSGYVQVYLNYDDCGAGKEVYGLLVCENYSMWREPLKEMA